MIPEIRKALETNTLPFGEMSRELQEALVIAIALDSQDFERKGNKAFCECRDLLELDHVYRLAPEPVTMPEYPWDLFDDEIQWMAINRNGFLVLGKTRLSLTNDSLAWMRVECFVSNVKFHRGNVAWQDSQMERPKK